MVEKAIQDAERKVRFYYRISQNELDALEFNEFFFRQKMIEDEEDVQERRRMIAAAFIGYQMGAGKKNQTLKSYLMGFNLLETPAPLTEEQRKIEIDRGLKKAESIRAKFRKGKFKLRKI